MALCELQYCPDLEQWHLITGDGNPSWPFWSAPMALRTIDIFVRDIASGYVPHQKRIRALEEAEGLRGQITKLVSQGLLKAKLLPDEEEKMRLWASKNGARQPQRKSSYSGSVAA